MRVWDRLQGEKKLQGWEGQEWEKVQERLRLVKDWVLEWKEQMEQHQHWVNLE